MRKRNTEGFALAYVVVVITVLCALSIGLMSISLRILQVQEKNMQRMQDKYEAQGAVELAVAELDLLESTISAMGSHEAENPDSSASPDEATEKAETAIREAIFNLTGFSVPDEDSTYVIEYSETVGDITVLTTLDLDFEINVYDTDVNNPNYKADASESEIAQDPTMKEPYLKLYWYGIKDFEAIFVSYKIVSAEGGQG